MSATLTVALLWLAFAASHIALSSQALRPALVARIGNQRFLGLYSLIAFAIFIPLVTVYMRGRHEGPWLWQLPRGPLLEGVMYLLMGIAFLLIVAGFFQPNPASLTARDKSAGPRGVLRITRHPVSMALTLFGLCHLLPNSQPVDLAFFAGFVLFTPLGAWHQDVRKAQSDPSYADFVAQTPFWPFTGAGSLTGVREIPLSVWALGIAVTWVTRAFLHSW